MLLLICAVVAVSAILYTFWVKPEVAVALSPAERERAFLNERKEVVYENLRDLHLEYRMGKLSDRDYQQLKEHYQEQLAPLLHALEQLPPQPAAASSGPAPFLQQSLGKTAATSADRESSTATGSGTCPRCGHANPPGNRFCGACGTGLTPPTESSP